MLLLGDCLERLKELPSSSVDAVVTDPPYGIRFMGRRWDHDVPSVAIWEECLRVLKPGGHLVAFAGTRTQHRMAVRIEDAGFEIRDMLAWLYGSGFPKSLNVSSLIDKRRHDRNQVLKVTAWFRFVRDANGVTNADIDRAFGLRGMANHWTTDKQQPAIPTLDQIDPLLKVLKVERSQVPADIARLIFELNGSKGEPGQSWANAEVIAEHEKEASVARWRKTVTNGDGPAAAGVSKAPLSPEAKRWAGWGTSLKPAIEPITLARKPFSGTLANNLTAGGVGALNIDASRIGDRFPANVIHDGSADVLDRLPGEGMKNVGRFFYCAKASPAEREEGLEKKNHHPTVKPLDLMAYLCRLVTPPGGVILDPFMGSGSTGKAARAAGFQFIGIEREPDFFELAKQRIGE